MKKIALDDLLSNEAYNAQRPALRVAIMEHKTNRRVALGPNATLHFEDYMTMRYQVQELMRAEHISDVAEIGPVVAPSVPAVRAHECDAEKAVFTLGSTRAGLPLTLLRGGATVVRRVVAARRHHRDDSGDTRK